MKSRVLVLCTSNSARSQMLHGLLEQDDALDVASAGVAPKCVHPQAVANLCALCKQLESIYTAGEGNRTLVTSLGSG